MDEESSIDNFNNLEEWFNFHVETIYNHSRGYDYYEMHNTLQELFELYYIHRKQGILKFRLYDEPDDLSTALEEYLRAYLLFIDLPEELVREKTENYRPYIKSALNRVNSVPPQKQRSIEWYEFRKRNFTASDFYKIFSDSQLNSVVKKKLHPNIGGGFNPSRMPLAIKRGIMYEDVAIHVYENMFKTKVCEHGCIPHLSIPGLAASPDGIIHDEDSVKYGHMLEIKCVLSRELNGEIPEVYWVQMQIQMEVCDLEFCDFFECDFKEKPSKEELLTYVDMNNTEYYGIFLEGMQKGTGEPRYIYSKLGVTMIEDVPDDFIYNRTHYWYLHSYTLRTIRRNRDWFSNILERFIYARDKLDSERIKMEKYKDILEDNHKEVRQPVQKKSEPDEEFGVIYATENPTTMSIKTNINLSNFGFISKKRSNDREISRKRRKEKKEKLEMNRRNNKKEGEDVFLSNICFID
jgi:putative phage-type endonuclease